MKRSLSIITETKNIKKVQTNQEKIETMLQSTEQSLFDSIVVGKVRIAQQKQQLQYCKQTCSSLVDPAAAIQQINLSLQDMRQSLVLKKKTDQQQDEAKREKAQKLIERMKRQKEEHRQRLKDRQNESRLILSKAFSETVLHKMRQQLQDRIVNKRKEIEERIKNIEARTKNRNEKIVKEYPQRSKSGDDSSQSIVYKSLNPQKPQTQTQNYTSLPKIKNIQKKNSFAKLDSIKLKMADQKNNPSQLRKIIESNQNLVLPKIGQKLINDSLIIKTANKLNKYSHNQFMEKLNFKRNQPLTRDIDYPEESNHNHSQEVQVLRQKWNSTLSHIEHQTITREQGLQQLNHLEKRLDKLDFKGLKQRLKLKYEAFLRLEESSDLNDNKQMQNEL